MGKAIGAAKISTKYQVVLPQEVREILKAKQGDYLLFFENKQGDVVIKISVDISRDS